MTATIGVGCFLLLLNVAIFVAIYYQREKRENYARRKEELSETDLVNSATSSLERQKSSRKSSMSDFDNNIDHNQERLRGKHLIVDHYLVEMPMNDLKCSSNRGSTNNINLLCSSDSQLRHSHQNLLVYPPIYVPSGPTNLKTVLVEHCRTQHQPAKTFQETVKKDLNPGLPLPPPPPKVSATFQAGILRSNQSGLPSTPSSSKKRVQIQEISV